MAETVVLGVDTRRPRLVVARAFAESPAAIVGLSLLVTLVLAAVFAPLLTPYDPLRGTGLPLRPPGPVHPMGTDDLGRDVLAQVLYGARVSLLIGVTASAIALAIGLVAGSLSGYFGGLVDDVTMRVTELFQVIPRVFLAILLVALFGQHVTVAAVAIGVLSWPPSARVLRAEFLARREAEYVLAARVVGASALHQIVREILPNAVSPMIVIASLNVGSAILLEAGLAFLGLSDPNVPSLGRILQESVQFLYAGWWMSLFPGLVVALLVVAMNLVGDGLNDVLNPRLRR
ncbi:MAG TPA: ABC transporter permease [Candidatus Limnocylindria bacterium]|nr:ABC transporter permease [Candidatus Limnocylindria bacterium]